MSIINKVSQLFSKSTPTQIMGVSFYANSIAYCVNNTQQIEKSESEHSSLSLDSFPLEPAGYSATLVKLAQEKQLSANVNVVLHSSQYSIVQVTKPDVPDAEILGALKWQLKDLVPMAPENMVLDYFDSPAGSMEQKINVVCAPLNELKSLVEQCQRVNLAIQSITIPEFAFANLLPNSDDAVLLVCQQPDEEIFIIIVKSGQIQFYRHLRGFAQIASQTEIELGFGIIDNLSLEIQKSTDFFERQLKQPAIQEIKVIMPMDLESLIANKLAENTHLPVSLLSYQEGLAIERAFPTAIGAIAKNLQVAE